MAIRFTDVPDQQELKLPEDGYEITESTMPDGSPAWSVKLKEADGRSSAPLVAGRWYHTVISVDDPQPDVIVEVKELPPNQP